MGNKKSFIYNGTSTIEWLQNSGLYNASEQNANYTLNFKYSFVNI